MPVVATNARHYDAAPITARRTTRIAFDTELTACDEPAMASVEYALATTAATITPRALRRIRGTCTGTARTVTRVIDLAPRQAGRWTVSITGGGSVDFNVLPAPATACDANSVAARARRRSS